MQANAKPGAASVLVQHLSLGPKCPLTELTRLCARAQVLEV
jgi:hypothetical protein